MGSRVTGGSAGLLRVLGISFGLAAVVGGVVGQGIMRAPGIVAEALPDPWLIIIFWSVGGLLALIDGFAIMELASSVPRAGGPYVWASRAFGPFFGKMLGWTDWTNGIVGIGFTAVVFAEYLHRLGLLADLPLGLIAVSLIGVLAAINWSGTRTSGATQTIGSAIKGLSLIALIIVLFSLPATTADLAPAKHLSPVLTVAAMVIALRAINNTYGGWNTAAYFCEEMDQPERNIVRSTFGGIIIVTVLYVLFNAALLHVLTPAQIAASTLPAADAVARALGDASGVLMTGLAIFSVVAITNLTVMFVTRICFGMARDGYLPARLATVSQLGTPRMALYATVIGGALLASIGGYERLVAIGAPTGIVINGVVDLAAIVLRYREPDLARPFKMPLFPLPALLGLLINGGLLAALVHEDPANSLAGVGFVAAIGLAYAAKQAWGPRKQVIPTQ